MKILQKIKANSDGLQKKLFTLALGLIFMPLMMMATHFRYGSISWTNTSGNTTVFKLQQSWRSTYPWGTPIFLGAVINVSASGSALFDFGDGNTADIILTVTSVNPGEGWFFGEATLTHTYATSGNKVAFYQGCCRISSLQNNANGNYRVQSAVNVGSGNSSPVSTIIPIVDVPTGNPSYVFNVPAVDPNGSPLNFRFSSSAEAGPGFVQPSGLSINAATGQMTFNTQLKAIGNLYTTQIMVSDGTIEVPLDFIIRISSNVGTPPYFVYPPTPANSSVITVNAGQTATFNLRAEDSDAGNTVALSVAGAPVGSTFSPSLPASGNPVTSTFSWLTTAANIGTYVLNFNAQDNTLQSAGTSVTINVVQACNLALSSSITNVSCNGEANGAIDLTVTGANGTSTILWSNGATTEDISGLSAGAYSVNVTDENGCTASASYNVTEPSALGSTSLVSADVSCNGGTNGAAVVSANGGTSPYQYTEGSTTNASGIFTSLSAGTYNYTVTDAKGCTSTGTYTITEPTAVTCAITVSPVQTVIGQASFTIFLGYGPQSVSLTGTGSGGSGGYSYNWGSAGTGSTINVSPAITTVYTLTVTDANECQSTCSITINVIDVRCGNKMDKVLVCHKTNGSNEWNNICISPNAVANHLSHGDYLGACNTARSSATANMNTEKGENSVFNLKVLSNPTSNYFTLKVSVKNDSERVGIRITDANGKQIEAKANLTSGQIITLGSSYKAGIYFAEMFQGKQKVTVKLIKQ